jgi:hypothetical protein
MKNLLKRIRQLEQHVPVQPTARTDEDSPLSEAFTNLLLSMDEHHAGLIIEDLEGVHEDSVASQFGRLTLAAFDCVQHHLSRGTPLEFPAEVAIVYLADPNAKPVHDCADCGYRLPFTWARPLSKPPRPVTAYFDCCPLCGGRVGWHAFSCNRGYCPEGAFNK